MTSSSSTSYQEPQRAVGARVHKSRSFQDGANRFNLLYLVLQRRSARSRSSQSHLREMAEESGTEVRTVKDLPLDLDAKRSIA